MTVNIIRFHPSLQAVHRAKHITRSRSLARFKMSRVLKISKLLMMSKLLTKCAFRHKRTHDRSDGAEGNFNLSGEDEEEYSGEDQLGALEDASPTSESAYTMSSLNQLANGHQTSPSNGMMRPTSMPSTQSYNSLQTLSMPMTMSQPHANDVVVEGMMYMNGAQHAPQ
jgi:hypothetical protein